MNKEEFVEFLNVFLEDFMEKRVYLKGVEHGPCLLCSYWEEDGFCGFFERETGAQDIHSKCFDPEAFRVFISYDYACDEIKADNEKYFEIYKKEGLLSTLERVLLDLQSKVHTSFDAEGFLNQYLSKR
jgi:hypothetical protein